MHVLAYFFAHVVLFLSALVHIPSILPVILRFDPPDRTASEPVKHRDVGVGGMKEYGMGKPLK